MLLHLLISLIVVTLCYGHDTNSSSSSELKIYRDIFKGYERNIRPVRNDSTQTKVLIRIWFMDIIHANPAHRTFDFSVDYGQTWKDEFLTWNPSDYGGIEHIRVPQDNLWMPDVLLYSLAGRPMFTHERRFAVIAHDGNVSIYSPQTLRLNCRVQVENFPYDTQSCDLQFVPWTYGVQQVIVKADPPPKVSGQEYEGIHTFDDAFAEWAFKSFKVFEIIENITIPNTGGQVTESINLSFQVELARRPDWYLYVLALPTYMITALCTVGIFTPFSSTGVRQEKVSLGLTTMLTIAVMLNIVADQMPKAPTLPRLGMYVLAELFFCMFTTMVAVIVMYVHQKALANRWPAPRWLQKVLFCKLRKNRHKNGSNTSRPTIHDLAENHKTGEDRRLLNILAEHDRTLKTINDWIENLQRETYSGEQWTELLNVVDIILLIIFQVANVLMSWYLIL